MTSKKCTCTCTLWLTLVVGIICAVIGVIMFPVFQFIIHHEIVEQTKLVNGTMGYDIWSDPTADVYMQFWVWHLTNPVEVKAGTKEPYLIEMGPYIYKEVMLKENITNHSNGTISYVQQKSYLLDLDNSYGNPQTDTFTSINIPLMTTAGMLNSLSDLEKAVIKLLMRSEAAFVSHTVHEIIWGYFDVLMAAAHAVGRAPYSDFGLFVERNNSNDGIYTVYSGVNEEDTDKINSISLWRGEPTLHFWSTPESNTINGSDGSYNAPFFKKHNKLYVFSSDICRSIDAVFEKETDVRNISTWRYVGPPEAFANATENPSNEGFCTPDSHHCLPSGLLNVSNCQFGAPIVMSLPHFLYCDQAKVIDLVNGVKPEKEVHQTFFDIEPMTGGPLRVAKRLQINVYQQPYEEVEQLKNLKKLFLPIVWLNESALLTPSGAQQLIDQIETPILLTTVGKWSVLGLGLLFIILSVTCLTVLWIRQTPQSSMIVNSMEGPADPVSGPPDFNHYPVNPTGSDRNPLLT